VTTNPCSRAAAKTVGNGEARPPDGTDPGTGPLTGIRVLDLGTVYAAPISAMLLGDYGADVVKVEHPDDQLRNEGVL